MGFLKRAWDFLEGNMSVEIKQPRQEKFTMPSPEPMQATRAVYLTDYMGGGSVIRNGPVMNYRRVPAPPFLFMGTARFGCLEPISPEAECEDGGCI